MRFPAQVRLQWLETMGSGHGAPTPLTVVCAGEVPSTGAAWIICEARGRVTTSARFPVAFSVPSPHLLCLEIFPSVPRTLPTRCPVSFRLCLLLSCSLRRSQLAAPGRKRGFPAGGRAFSAALCRPKPSSSRRLHLDSPHPRKLAALAVRLFSLRNSHCCMHTSSSPTPIPIPRPTATSFLCLFCGCIAQLRSDNLERRPRPRYFYSPLPDLPTDCTNYDRANLLFDC